MSVKAYFILAKLKWKCSQPISSNINEYFIERGNGIGINKYYSMLYLDR